jgi:5-aminolevulinate synthase
MTQHPAVMKAVKDAVDAHGTGSGGTRNIGGNSSAHGALEKRLAAWHNKDAALIFSSGYVANEATLSSLGKLLPNCVFISDEENHASMIRGMQNVRGARTKVFRHNDLKHLREVLSETKLTHPQSSLVVAFESVYSMSGTIAPIGEIVQIAKEFGALTYLDEVHAVGLYGHNGSGVAERDGVADHVDIIQGTLGKAVGCFGGYILCNRTIMDAIRCVASGFIFTTSMPPHVAAGAIASINTLASEEGREIRNRFHGNVKKVKDTLEGLGFPVREGNSHIVPLLVMNSVLCKKASDILIKDHNIYIQPINYPTVKKGRERLRITPSNVHTDENISELINALMCVWNRLGLPFNHKFVKEAPDALCPEMLKRTMTEYSARKLVREVEEKTGEVAKGCPFSSKVE